MARDKRLCNIFEWDLEFKKAENHCCTVGDILNALNFGFFGVAYDYERISL